MPKFNAQDREAGEIEPGMWLADQDGRVGLFYRSIRRDKKTNAVIERRDEFHVVDAQGDTVLIVTMAGSGLEFRQATLAEIPEPRRPAPDLAARLRYI